MPSESYDCVVSREGIEHPVTPFAFLRELCRLVKPNGHLVITTPNIMSMDSRLKFLVGGYFRSFRELRDNHDGLRSLAFQGHISPIYYWQLLYFLGNAGFEPVRVTMNALLEESKPLKRLMARWMASVVRKTAQRRGMFDEMTHADDVLFGDSLIVIARKVREPRSFHGELF
jgi:SAM-dependent methyltransferase